MTPAQELRIAVIADLMAVLEAAIHRLLSVMRPLEYSASRARGWRSRQGTTEWEMYEPCCVWPECGNALGSLHFGDCPFSILSSLEASDG